MNTIDRRFQRTRHRVPTLILLAVLSCPLIARAAPLTSATTYQGKLTSGGTAVNSQVDMVFTLYDAETLGNPVGSPVVFDGQAGNGAPLDVVDGVFTAMPDFGAAVYDGSALWLEIQVRSPHDPSNSAAYTTLTPRQPMTAAPYAQKALSVSGIDGHSLDADDGSPIDALFVNNAGRVGIGTTAPLEKLNISEGDLRVDRGTLTVNQQAKLFLYGARVGGINPYASIEFGNYDDDSSAIDYIGARILSHNDDGDADSGDLRFSTKSTGDANPVVRMRILPSGNVGIAKSNPTNALSVGGHADFDGFVGIGTDQPQTPLSIMGNGGTAPVGITQNAVGGSSTMELTTTDSSSNQATRILMRGGSGGDTADIEFYTGASGAETQTMIIDGATGNVGIGSSANPSSKLDVDGTVTATAFVGDGSGLTGIGSADGHSLDAADGAPVDALYVDNAGRIGIGTTSPTEVLHISDGTPEVIVEAANSGAAGMQFKNIDYGYSIRMTNSEKFVLRDLTAGNVDRLVIDQSGDIGIGTSNPEGKLSISNGGTPVCVTQGNLAGNGMELTTRDAVGTQATRLKINAITSDARIEFYRGNRGSEIRYLDFVPTSDGGEMQFLDSNGLGRAKIGATSNGGQVNIRDTTGVLQAQMYVDSNGDGVMETDVLKINGGADIAEPFNINVDHDAVQDDVVPGMVVSIDPTNVGELRLSTSAYDRTVAGIISGAGGVKPGMTLQQPGTLADGKHPVALTGRVWCYVDATQAAINPGDLLTTSGTPGHAMKVGDHDKAQGAIIGKAMTSLESGRGLVLVLVTLQ